MLAGRFTMIDTEAMKRIAQLEKQYEINWGIPVDYSIIPRGVTLEKLVEILE